MAKTGKPDLGSFKLVLTMTKLTKVQIGNPVLCPGSRSDAGAECRDFTPPTCNETGFGFEMVKRKSRLQT